MKLIPSGRSAARPVRGHIIRKPRLTLAGWLLLLLWIGLPAMLIGAALDLAWQWISGDCVGFWCLFT
jgi:hypothetical protein